MDPVIKRSSNSDSKVFVIGFSKTGTSTLKEMLTTLGYRVCGPKKRLLHEVRAGNIEAINDTLADYDAFEDWPWPLVYRYVNELYGAKAKFILTQRTNSEIWFKSVENHGLGTSPTKSMRDAYGYYRPFGKKEKFVKAYEDHNEAVRSYFSQYPEQFLELCLERGDGWEKLCSFLGQAVPKIAVPHRNQTVPGRKRLTRLVNKLLIAPIYSRV